MQYMSFLAFSGIIIAGGK